MPRSLIASYDNQATFISWNIAHSNTTKLRFSFLILNFMQEVCSHKNKGHGFNSHLDMLVTKQEKKFPQPQILSQPWWNYLWRLWTQKRLWQWIWKALCKPIWEKRKVQMAYCQELHLGKRADLTRPIFKHTNGVSRLSASRLDKF